MKRLGGTGLPACGQNSPKHTEVKMRKVQALVVIVIVMVIKSLS
jgi:hypothetical protein